MSEKENNQKKFDLLECLINYAIRIINVSEQLPENPEKVSFKHSCI